MADFIDRNGGKMLQLDVLSADPEAPQNVGEAYVYVLDQVGIKVIQHGQTPQVLLRLENDGDSYIELAPTRAGAGSFQTVAADLNLDPGAGSNGDGGDTDFLAGVMGNIIGADLTAGKDANYLGGVIGHFNITGTKRTTYPSGAILAGIGDGVTQVDGAVVAYIDGDSAQTNCGAMFKVRSNNSNGASGPDFGLDLQDAAHDGFQAVNRAFYKKAQIRLTEDVVIFTNAGAPVNGTTLDNVAGKGALCIDTTNGELYINTGTLTDSTWVKVGTQA